MFCDIRHNLPHLHRLARWHFLNADHDLVVGRFEASPKAASANHACILMSGLCE
jgi:hypothetical protein